MHFCDLSFSSESQSLLWVIPKTIISFLVYETLVKSLSMLYFEWTLLQDYGPLVCSPIAPLVIVKVFPESNFHWILSELLKYSDAGSPGDFMLHPKLCS